MDKDWICDASFDKLAERLLIGRDLDLNHLRPPLLSHPSFPGAKIHILAPWFGPVVSLRNSSILRRWGRGFLDHVSYFNSLCHK
jgi:hypothetical protein